MRPNLLGAENPPDLALAQRASCFIEQRCAKLLVGPHVAEAFLGKAIARELDERTAVLRTRTRRAPGPSRVLEGTDSGISGEACSPLPNGGLVAADPAATPPTVTLQ